MSKVVVLGGCGAVGSIAAGMLVYHPEFSEVVIADANMDAARKMVQMFQSPKVSAVQFDALNPASTVEAVRGCDVVLNCVGPFYTTVKPVMQAVMQAGVNYVDVNDDVDVTIEALDMDAEVKKAGITVVVGLGNSPGITNMLARYAYDTLLDETEAVDIFHAHGGEPFEGEGVIGHRFHVMTIPIPMYLDGKMTHVRYFEKDGLALRTTFTFPILGEVPVYPYAHPEQVTLPRSMKLKRVTNRGTVIPNEYYNLTRDLCQLGFTSQEPLMVKGQTVIPYDFAVAYILRERERILKETQFGTQRGCTTVVVTGVKDGKYRQYRFHTASQSQALGEGTGVPAAMGAILMNRGQVNGKGAMPPEACINPAHFLALLPEILPLMKSQAAGKAFEGFLVESVDENGTATRVDF